MTFAIDMDGCIADFCTSFAKILLRIQPMSIDIYASDFPCCWSWPEFYGFDKDVISRAWTEAENSGMFWKHLHPYPSAPLDLAFLNNLAAKHNIYFMTHRRGVTAKQETEEWLWSRGMKNPTVILCEGTKKGEVCRLLGAELIVDDAPDTLLKVPTGIKTVLMRRPWNIGYNGYFSKTVDSVREALDGIC